MSEGAELIAIISEARKLLALPGNDFFWSGWDSAEEALREIDQCLGQLRKGETPNLSRMTVLFAPTGSMQEVSIASGWSDQYIRIAGQFDAAVGRFAR